MIITEVHRYCDLCKTEVERYSALRQILLPVRFWDEQFGIKDVEGMQKLEVCSKCLEKYNKAIKKHFADITFNSVKDTVMSCEFKED